MNRFVLAGLGSVAALAVVVGAISLASGDDRPDGDGAAALEPSAPTSTPVETPLATRVNTPVVSPNPPTTAPVAPAPTNPPSTAPAPAPTNPPAPPNATQPPAANTVPAPIDGLELIVRPTSPRQYALRVVAGLPDGCARPAGHSVEREASAIRIQVLNSRAPSGVFCTAVYGNYELTIELGSDFEPGRDYIAEVNSRRLTFKAQ